MAGKRHLVNGVLAALMAVTVPGSATGQDSPAGQAERARQRGEEATLEREVDEEQREALREQAEEEREATSENAGTNAEEALLGGFVAEISPATRRLTLLDPETGRMRDLEINENTRLTRQGQRIGLLQLEPGTEVGVSVHRWGDDDLAQSVEVKQPAGAIVRFGQPTSQNLLDVRGRVIGESALPPAVRVLDPGKGMVFTLVTNAGARLTEAGQPIAFEELEQGDEVRASCLLTRGECTLGTLELRSKGPGNQEGDER